jgi:DNA-binding NtrC family response regulator
LGGEQTKILAVDDNEEALFALAELLKSQGYEVKTAGSGEETLKQIKSFGPDLVLLDIQMPGPDGYEVTKIIKADPNLKYTIIVLLSAKDNLDDVVEGLNLGADGYITKPFKKEELLARVYAALRLKKLYDERKVQEIKITELKSREAGRSRYADIIGQSPAMQNVFSLIEKIADSDAPVLVNGESGTGKELVARALHYQSSRRDKMFVAQNCSAFNDNLLESELFGHVKGSFTGAIRDKQGLFEIADGGTFFLDELGEMSAALQVKLLRVVQEGTFIPVGGTKTKQVNVRVVTATHRNLLEMVEKGTFREDLYYRLNVVNIKLPPLRDRIEDIPVLIEFFMDALCRKKNIKKKVLSAEAMNLLCAYRWPGNIRELQNELERITLLSADEVKIDARYISDHIKNKDVKTTTAIAGKSAAQPDNLKEAVEVLEKQMILSALNELSWNKSEAAKKLGISRTSLIAKVQEYGLEK